MKRELNRLRNIRYQARLFAYTHLPLAQRIYDLCRFTDDQLHERVVRESNSNYILNHITETYPYASRTVYEGMLPDISTIAMCIPFLNPAVNDNRTSNKPPNKIFKMFSKFLPRNSQMRSHASKHILLCKEHLAYFHFTVQIMEVMLLGAYKHSDHIPPFKQAIAFYKLLGTDLEQESFLNWQQQRSSLVVLAFREYLCYMIELAAPYDEHITHCYPHWTVFKQRVYECSDMVRMCMHHTSMNAIQYLVQNIFKGSSPNASSPFSDPYLLENFGDEKKMHPDVRRLAGDTTVIQLPIRRIAVDPVRTICWHLNTLKEEWSQLGHKRPPKMPTELHQAIFAKAMSLKPHTPVDVRWLSEFNFDPDNPLIKPRTIQLLEYIFCFIAHGGANTNDYIRKALKAIDPLEYEVVDCFFNLLLTQYSVNIYEMPRAAQSRQILALRRRYSIDEERPNSMKWGPWTFCICLAPCCAQKKTYDAQSNGAYAFGIKQAAIDVASGTLVCRSE